MIFNDSVSKSYGRRKAWMVELNSTGAIEHTIQNAYALDNHSMDNVTQYTSGK